MLQGCEGYLMAKTNATVRYELELGELLAVIGPPACAIHCLESPCMNPADVFKYWVALGAWYERTLMSSDISFGSETTSAIASIFNHRYKQMIDEAPTDLYYVAFCLDPSTCQLL